jgi:hypothetical protein
MGPYAGETLEGTSLYVSPEGAWRLPLGRDILEGNPRSDPEARFPGENPMEGTPLDMAPRKGTPRWDLVQWTHWRVYLMVPLGWTPWMRSH